MLFVCVITAPGDSVEVVQTVDVPSDALACDRALEMAAKYSTAHGYQVWQAGRKIAAYYPRATKRAAASSPQRFAEKHAWHAANTVLPRQR
jgi:hypothetical protein